MHRNKVKNNLNTIIFKNQLLYIILFITHYTTYGQLLDSKNKIIQIDSILIEGNYKTKRHIIERELSIQAGNTYQYTELDSLFLANQSRIYNTNLFNEISIKLINQKDQHADLLLIVKERWYIIPIPIFKLVDRNFNEWWVIRNRDLKRINYQIKFIHLNFRGRRERLSLLFQTGFENQVGIYYNVPYIEKGLKHGLTFNLNYIDSKSIAYKTIDNVYTFLGGEVTLYSGISSHLNHRFRNSYYSTHDVTIGYISSQIADTVNLLNSNYFGNNKTRQEYFSISYRFIHDKRNNRNYPTQGSYYSTSISKIGIGIKKDVNYWLGSASIAKYFQIRKKFYSNTSLLGTFSFPSKRPYFNYSSTAISREPNVLRGFDLKIIEGSNFIILRNDIKYKIFSFNKDLSDFISYRQFQTFPLTLFAKIFFDQGFASSIPDYEYNTALNNNYLFSVGIGIDLITIYDQVIRMELSKNTLNQNHLFINFRMLF